MSRNRSLEEIQEDITFRNGDFGIIEDERDKAVEEWNRRAEDGKTD